ncbi:MAG: transporter [Nitrosomonas sp.]|nr:transporter [Nitrosomonas sp.]
MGGPSTTTSSQSGLGDIITAFSYNLIDHAPTGIGFDITTRLKIPTASASRNLGTGQVDFAIQGDLYKTISRFTLSATFGYRVLGNPAGVTFHNVLYGAAGIGYQLSSRTSIGTSYNMGQSPVKLQDSRDISIYVSQRVSDNFRLNIYGLRGLSERSPDWGGGLNLRYVF